MIFPVRLTLAILLSTTLFACGDKKELPLTDTVSMPADSLIAPEKMVLILSDVHVVEAAMLLDRNEGREPKHNPDHYYNGIFRKYHISAGRYDQNLIYYRQSPDDFMKIYEKVISQVEARKKYLPGPK
jgi:hypothetical protein